MSPPAAVIPQPRSGVSTSPTLQVSCRQVPQLPGDPVQATALPYPIITISKAAAPHDDTEKAGPTRTGHLLKPQLPNSIPHAADAAGAAYGRCARLAQFTRPPLLATPRRAGRSGDRMSYENDSDKSFLQRVAERQKR